MRLAVCTSVFVAFLLMLAGETGSRERAATRLSHMAFRDFAVLDGRIVAIRGELGPASFFKSLHSVEQEDRTVVLNDQGEVQFFPNRVTITLFLMGPIPKVYERTPLSFDRQYMEGLQFKAEWKRGLHLRAVNRFRELTASASQAPYLGPLLPRFEEWWIYEFVVEDTEVPIDDHLILYIISPENKRIARLSARL